ncbi:MAG: hypothetical protein ACXVHC_01630 [Frankiaceae bacterium]
MDDPAPDGVPAHAFPAHAFPASTDHQPGRLPQRDFDLNRSLGLLPGGGPPPAATAVLLTTGDDRADWLRAGQALHRLLAHAASKWVFASLHTQPLESEPIRALIRDRLALPGFPQILLQLGPAHTTRVTARQPTSPSHETGPERKKAGSGARSCPVTGPRPRLAKAGYHTPHIDETPQRPARRVTDPQNRQLCATRPRQTADRSLVHSRQGGCG